MESAVKEYYGKTLQSSEDLKTNACCTFKAPPQHIKHIIEQIHDEVVSKYYGCGLTIPKDFSLLKGMEILDLGSGSGRDCYILSQLVGCCGKVVGVDMTDEMLEVANRHIEYHTKEFGLPKANVSFKKGNIQDLAAVGLEDDSFDLIVSNCVVNLAEDKDAVLREAYRILKPGGEMYFSDVYADRRIPEELQKDNILWGECLSGALYWNDFVSKAKLAGFAAPRIVEVSPIAALGPVAKQLGNICFASVTYRLWKIPGMEPSCEDYGQAVVYKGTIEEFPHSYQLDCVHTFITGKVEPVCSSTFKMISETRLNPHFTRIGDESRHFGLFPGCNSSNPFDITQETQKGDGSKSTSKCCC
jgi:ubiquinone/menaquinone biosynthesis C-methylase UbiE